MKKVTTISLFLLAVVLTLGTSCKKKDRISEPPVTVKALLTAHTWQVYEATFYADGVNPELLYKRGEAGNVEDYSLVRNTFKNDGTIAYVDDSGNSGNDGHYELLDNDQKIKIIVPSMEVICENLTVTATSLSYKLPVENGYVLFKFSPAQ